MERHPRAARRARNELGIPDRSTLQVYEMPRNSPAVARATPELKAKVAAKYRSYPTRR
jgi:hypothetical protein